METIVFFSFFFSFFSHSERKKESFVTDMEKETLHANRKS